MYDSLVVKYLKPLFFSLIMKVLLEELIVPAKNRDFVNNESFIRWNGKIMKGVVNRFNGLDDQGMPDNEYGDSDKVLLNKCKSHASNYSSPLSSENIVVLTHPLYMFLSHSSLIKGAKRLAAENYYNNLSRLLNNRSSIDANIVVFDTLHHYADSTSRLLEEGFIDNVFFTKYDNGVPNDDSYKEHFSGKNLFFGGSYNTKCLSSSVAHSLTANFKSAWCINGLILNSPLDKSRLESKYITFRNGRYVILPEYSISLDELFEMTAK